MFYQSEHGKPLVGGKIARKPREAFDLIDSVPVYRALLRLMLLRMKKSRKLEVSLSY